MSLFYFERGSLLLQEIEVSQIKSDQKDLICDIRNLEMKTTVHERILSILINSLKNLCQCNWDSSDNSRCILS